jgi:exodeoxyribonuclease VII large subunit
MMMEKFASMTFWVTAEVSKINEKGGHSYLELVDSSEEGLLTAKIQASMWRSAYEATNLQLNGELPKILVSGNKVLLEVKIEYHKIYGLKLNILSVDPSITFGEIERKKKETIERLKSEGLYELQHNLYLSPILKRIALVGSPDTSGFRDFLSELFSNNIYRNFKVKEFPSSVQGDRAKPELLRALKEAKQYSVDVIVLLRGGGSKIDLDVFNDYDIAQEIALTTIPVMTGIGHESDEVVADLVCRKSHITPTAVAKYLYMEIGVFSSHYSTAFDSIKRQSQELLYSNKEEFEQLSKYFFFYSTEIINAIRKGLQEEVHGLRYEVNEMILDRRSDLKQVLSQISNHSLNAIELERTGTMSLVLDKINLLSSGEVATNKILLDNIEEKLSLLNPMNLLNRGYTISTVEDVDINKEENILGKKLKTLTNNKIITSTITKEEDNEWD